jgi:hypothetical protein
MFYRNLPDGQKDLIFTVRGNTEHSSVPTWEEGRKSAPAKNQPKSGFRRDQTPAVSGRLETKDLSRTIQKKSD